jgi:Ca2+-binding EF-hand superfamily protein
MRRTGWIFLLFCGLAALAQEQQQQQHDGPRRGFGREGGPGGGRGPMMMSPSMRILDADRDGVISATEIQQAAAQFAKLDADGDGKLTEAEIRPAFGGGPRREGGPGGPGGPGGASPEETVAMMLQFDKNGDGMLQKSEVSERMQGIFARGDANQDGVLTREELLQAAQKQSQQAPASRGGGGERRGGFDGERRGPGGGPGGMMRLDPVMRALDTDEDGVISAAEWSKAPQALAKFDKNGDGQLTPDELRPNFPGRERRDQ